MCEMKLMDLQLFGEGGDGGAAGDAGQGEGSAAEINIGDVLADGTVVDESLDVANLRLELGVLLRLLGGSGLLRRDAHRRQGRKHKNC